MPTMNYNPNLPYNDLPSLPPASEIETKFTLRACANARAALGELKGAGGRIPNQSVLINAIVLQEAKASSEIENIVTTQDRLYEAMAGSKQDDPYTKEVLRYREALAHGCSEMRELRRPISTNAAVTLCGAIRGVESPIRSDGTALVNETTKSIIYTPPSGKNLLLSLLDNLFAFLSKPGGIDPLIRMAVAHYQFEAIHPFSDGNGRTGRILNILYLLQQELLEIPVLYLSRHIIDNKSLYYHNLREVTEHGRWEDWIIYMLEGVEQTARQTAKKIYEIDQLMNSMKRKMRSVLPKTYSRELLDILFTQPYCRISDGVEAKLGSRITIGKYFARLVEHGFLSKVTFGKTNVYINTAFLEVLRNSP
jgi:Fic family protein